MTCYVRGTCYLACYVPLNIHNMGVVICPMAYYGCKTWQGDKIQGKKGRLKEKCNSILILIALTFKH
jgi:hypothetical protein